MNLGKKTSDKPVSNLFYLNSYYYFVFNKQLG